MLKLLHDEHISPAVANGLGKRVPALEICAMRDWRCGAFIGADDAEFLREAAVEGRTVVTYDLRTIPSILKRWTEEGVRHGGALLVDEKMIPPSDIGGLIEALEKIVREGHQWDWTDRMLFVKR